MVRWNRVQRVYRLYVKCLLGCFSHEFVSHILMRVVCIQLPHVLHVYSLRIAPQSHAFNYHLMKLGDSAEGC